MSDDEPKEVHVLHCAGCRRPMGVYETAQLRSAVWCGEFCHSLAGVTNNEVRDDLMTELSRAGRTDADVGALFGVTRSRAQRVVAARTRPPHSE